MEHTTQSIRAKFWYKIFTSWHSLGKPTTLESSAKVADEALALFDKRFPQDNFIQKEAISIIDLMINKPDSASWEDAAKLAKQELERLTTAKS